MSRITITLHIDIPDGAKVQTPDVDYANGPQEPADLFVPPIHSYDPEQAVRPVSVPAPMCQQHGAMQRFPAGKNKAGNPYNASWRCASKGCETKPIWDRDAA